MLYQSKRPEHNDIINFARLTRREGHADGGMEE